MSRLIRDTDLIEWIDMCEKKLFPALSKDGTVKSNLTVVLEAIAATPTAYSVEAVVRELEEISNGFFVDGEELGEMFVKTIPLPLAIEIVRGGRND